MADAPDLRALQHRAVQCMQEGRIAEGIEAHRELLKHVPHVADAWFNLAWLERCDRQFDASLTSYSQAIEQGVRGPEEAHLNRAVILSDHLGRVSEAKEVLGAALKLAPNFLAAWLNLGNLHEDLGDVAGARHAYESAVRIEPTNGRALARLAAISIHEGDPASSIERLKAAHTAPGLREADRIEIEFALGNAYDAVGDYSSAFSAIAAANRLVKTSGTVPNPIPPNAEATAIIAAFPSALPLRDTEAATPIFICGMFRSGSTLVEQILARHSRVTAGGELEALPALSLSQLQPWPDAARNLSEADRVRLAETYMAEVLALNPGADILTDKRCDNYLHIGLIKALFPTARIIHTRRNPLDNLLSIYFLYAGVGMPYAFDMRDIAERYHAQERLMAHWKALYPEDIHSVDYDALVANPKMHVEALLNFCGLDFEEACLNSTGTSVPVRTASVWQVRQPVHTKSSGRWRNYEAELAPVMALIEAANPSPHRS